MKVLTKGHLKVKVDAKSIKSINKKRKFGLLYDENNESKKTKVD